MGSLARGSAISVNRRQAADLLGVSIDVIKAAQASGALRAKNTKIDPNTGRPVGVTLYSVAELERWFESLEDA